MHPSRNKTREINQQEYAESYDLMPWVSPDEARQASDRREALLADLPPSVRIGNCGTKVYSHDLSPGCRICGRGSWSCLFINGQCNARCFYCPSPQPAVGEPETNGIRFSDAQDYADYLAAFRFSGMSISGGEPLLTLERSAKFISKAKKKFAHVLHVWLYTNGILVSDDKLKQLREAGLDEIRFDISANRYDLEKVKSAVGLIPTVTVEIPAIPEDCRRLQQIVVQLADIGVSHLNLHQLRCTPHNCTNLLRRNYTFLHGPKVTVLESELSALEIIRYACEHGITLPINYCSFVYKSRFQTAAYRRRLAPLLCKPHESVTPAGAIRKLTVRGAPGRIEDLVRVFETKDQPHTLWTINQSGTAVSFHPALWPHLDFNTCSLFVAYDVPQMKPSVSYRGAFRQIALNRKKSVVVERISALSEMQIPSSALQILQKLACTGQESDSAEAACAASASARKSWEHLSELVEVSQLEQIQSGLQDYF
jgi:pyruvate formate-lyase activating enzyme-like uncharacterized protein